MQLADLRWHWGDAYEINWSGAFRAVRRDNGLVLDGRFGGGAADAHPERLLTAPRSETTPTARADR